MSLSSIKLKKGEVKNLVSTLKGKVKILKPEKNEEFRAEFLGKKIIIYETGKIVYQRSKEVVDLIKKAIKKGTSYDFLIGSDEAGKGEKLGPLVVAAVRLTPEQALDLKLEGVMDSKSLDLRRLKILSKKIKKKAEDYEVLCLMPDQYNQLYSELGNLNRLLERAHKQAITAVLSKKGKTKITVDKFMKKEFKIGDLKIKAKHDAEIETEVAAASVLAKLKYEENKQGFKEHFKG